MAGGNAYNSFTQFRVGAGNTVTLQVPDSAGHLVNIVTGSAVTVNGVLNSLRDGQIGGNVVFADPYGFIVGAQGTLNVGSLQVTTPTPDFLNRLMDPHGMVDPSAAAQLLAGEAPLSPLGTVSIRGRVNAASGVAIQAQNVGVGRDAFHRAKFQATVNTDGVQEAAGIVVRNGDIDIVAAGDAALTGTLSANGAAGRAGGHIGVTAGHDLSVAGTARVSTAGVGAASAGGSVRLYASNNVTVASGAVISAAGGTSGDGGQIEVSAGNIETIARGTTFNVGATAGRAGGVVFDPAQLVIGVDPGQSSGQVTDQNSIASGGGDVTLSASTSIEVVNGAYINTRKVAPSTDPNDPTNPSIGNSGSIAMTAPLITLDPGSKLMTFATDTFSAGNVTLNATGGTINFPVDPNDILSAEIATRVIASGTGADLVHGASTGASGNVTLAATTINFGSGVNTAAANGAAPGVQILANTTLPDAAVQTACNSVCVPTAVTTFAQGTITLDTPAFALASGQDILTRGANLVVNAPSGVTLDAGSLINARHLADGVDPTDPAIAVLDPPGGVTFNAGSFAAPAGMNTVGGAAVLAGGYGGGLGFAPGTITISVPGALSIDNTLASAGANLALAAPGGITLGSSAVLTTRQVAAGADPTDPTQASQNISGALTLTAASGNITVDAGAQLLTFASDQFYGGAVTLTSGGTISFPTGTGNAVIATRAITSGANASLIDTATADANDITLTAATAIDLPAGINTPTGVTMLAGAPGFLPGTITLQAPTIDVTTANAIHTAGANLAIDAGSAFTLGAGAEIDTRAVASGADPTSAATASVGPSGSIAITTQTATLGAGSFLLSFADSGFAAGAVTIAAPAAFDVASGGGGSATIDTHATGGGNAGAMTMPVPNGGVDAGINTATGYALLAYATGGGAPGTIALSAPDITVGGSAQLLTLGANLTLTATTGSVVLDAGALISTRQIASGADVTDYTVASTGNSGNLTLIGSDTVSWPVGINVTNGPSILANANAGFANGTITIQEPFVPMGAVGTTLIDTLGANLTLIGTTGSAGAAGSRGVELGSGGTINTQQLNAGHTASIGNSGDVTLIGYEFGSSGFPGVNVPGGATIDTAADSGFTPGTLTIQYQIDNGVPVTFNGDIQFPGGDVAIVANQPLTIGSSAIVNLSQAGITRAIGFSAPVITIDPGAAITATAISEAADSFDITSANSIYAPGEDVTLTATGAITVETGGVISTRQTGIANDASLTDASTGSSGMITLTGASITVDGLLNAAAVNVGQTDFTAGDITLTATNSAAPVVAIGGSYDATGSITVGGTVTGGNIALSNTSTATSTVTNTAAGVAEMAAAGIISELLGGNVGVMLATANSTVEITGTGSVIGTGNVSLDAIGNATASNATASEITTGLLSLSRLAGSSAPIPLPAVDVGEVTDISKALIDSGATVSAGGLLSVRAHNTDTLAVSTTTLSTNNTIDLAAAYSTTDIESTATIAGGAKVTAGSVRVVALNDNSWSTSASVSDMLQGTAGAVLALANGEKSTATAQENASLTLRGSTVADGASLLVQAQSVNALDAVSASASVGSGKVAGVIFGTLNGGASYLTSKLGNNSALFSNSQSTSKPRLAFAVALTLANDQTANALIGGDGATPTIVASGPVLADATVTDGGARSEASSQISSNNFASNSSQNPGVTYSISAAVAIADITHTADAEVGTQTNITAPSVGLFADTNLPLNLPITKWNSFTDVLDNLESLTLGTLLGNTFNEFITSGANATGDAQKLGGSGSVNYFQVTDNTTAWVGQGAVLTVLPVNPISPNVSLDTGDDASNGLLNGTAASQAWTQAVAVSATNDDQVISVGGALNILGLLLGNSSNKAATVGGSFSMNQFATTTLAGIGADATVDTNGVIAVTTLSDNLIVSIVPASGRGGAIAVAGMVGLNDLNNVTHSSISNTADITADSVQISATQTLFDLVEAGSIEQANTATVGIGVALNIITTNTEAYIGNNAADDPTGAVAMGFTAPVAGITASAVSVDAITDGQVIALGVGAAVASSSDPNAPQQGDNPSASTGNQVESTDDPVLDNNTPGLGSKITSALTDAFQQVTNAPAEEPNQPSFGLGISGSVAIDSATLTTTALIDGATITYAAGTGGDFVQVEALRDTWLTTAAGAAAILHPNSTSSQTNVGVAGAAAVDVSDSATSASITGAHVTGFTDTTVQALAGGEQIVIGLDFSASGGGGDEGVTIGIAASVSVALFTDSVSAAITNSTIAGDDSMGSLLQVIAYDRTDIGIGAGSLYVKAGEGNGGGGGAALTYAQISDPNGGQANSASISGSTIDQFDQVAVDATTADRIITGAAMISGGTNTNGLSGAVTVADITTTTQALIAASTVNVIDSVNVTADGGDRSALDTLISNDGVPLAANNQPEASPIDFSGAEAFTGLGESGTTVGPGSDIIAVAGDLELAFGENSKVNVGLTLVVNIIGQTDTASIAGGSIVTGTAGSVSVTADDQSMILGISAGAALATGGFAGLGSVAVNIVSNTATATLGDPSATSNTTSVQTGSLTVQASNTSTTESFAGNITLATNGPAAGAAIGYSGTTETTTASAVNASLDVGTLAEIDAATNGLIESAAVAAVFAAGDNGLAFGGSATANVIGNTTIATAQDVSLNDPTVFVGMPAPAATDVLEVLASDTSTIKSLAGALSIGQQAGIGVSIAYNSIDNTIAANVLGNNAGGVGDPRIYAQDALVSAASDGTIQTLGVGGGGGQTIAAAGSFAISTLSTTVTADIDQDAIVDAADNVYVLASDNNAIQVLAGGLAVSAGGDVGAGIGFSEAFNVIGGSTTAYIGGNSTVNAQGANPAHTCIQAVCGVNDGTLVTPPDVDAITAPSVSTFDLTEQQQAVAGLAVDATSDEQVIANAATLGVALNPEGSIGVGLNVVENDMGGDTTAYIGAAQIDTGLTANPAAAGYQAPMVFINASSHAYSGNFVVALSGSIYAGASGVADSNQIDRTTKAYIDSTATVGAIVAATTTTVTPVQTNCTDSNVNACSNPFTLTTIVKNPAPSAGAVTVNAASTADTANIVIGLSAAGGAVTGTVAVNLFAPETDAYVAAGASVTANSLTVAATTETGSNVLAGAAALGGDAGAGAFGVLVSNDTTQAYIGDKVALATPTTLTIAGALSVNAATTDDFNAIVVSGALAGGIGIAGMANVDVITNTTTAGVYDLTVGQTGAPGTQGAPTQDPNNIDNTIQLTDNTTSGKLLAPDTGVSINAQETVNVGANAGALAVSFGTAGVGAGATVVVLKSNTTAEAADSTIDSAGTVGVVATSDKTIQASAVSLGAGLDTGIGGAAALILLGSGDTGDSMSELNANGSGTLSSVNGATMGGDTQSAQASPGMSGQQEKGLGTAYSVTGTINNASDDAVTAAVEGGSITANELDVHATATVSTSNVTGGGGISVGLGAGGAVSFTRIYDTVTASETQATVDATTVSIKAIVQDGGLQLNGKAAGTAAALSAAGGAGLVGLGAAVSDVAVNNHVTADAGGTLDGTGTLTVDAEDNSTLTAGAYGAEVGAAAVGVVVGIGTKTSEVDAFLVDDASVSGYATTTISATQAGSLSVTTIGAAGGLLAAGTGAASTATNLSTVEAYTGTNVMLPDGNIGITATNGTVDVTSSLGVAGGLYFAAGVAVSESFSGNPVSDPTQPIDPAQAMVTEAWLGNGDQTSSIRTGALSILAQGVDVNTATATAGAGGAVAGDASLAYTNDTAITTVSIGTPALDINSNPIPLMASTVTLGATHTVNFGAMANSGNAAILGGSGAQAQNTVDLDSTATVANNAAIVASGLVQIGAANNFVETTSGDAAFGAAGGVANGAAALGSTTITSNSGVTLGTGVAITSGTDPVAAPGGIALTAGVLGTAGDQVVLDTGGALEGAVTQNVLTLTLNESVEVGANDNLQSQGNIGAGTYAQVIGADPQAYANTYGLAVVGTATATANVTVTQTVNIDAGAQMIAFGNVNATAGIDPTGSYDTLINASPNAQAYALGLVGIPSVTANDTITSNATVTIAAGALLRSAQNVVIGSYPGTPVTNPTAHGVGDVVGVPVDTGTSNTDTNTSSVLNMNGTAEAGYYAHLAIDIPGCVNPAAFCGNAVQTSGLPTTLVYNPSENLVPVIDQYWTDLEAQTSIEMGIADGPVGTYTIGTLFAAGGEVTVNAATITGTGTLSAQGMPSITVTNESPDYLVFGAILIPGQPGGAVTFTGAAGLSQALAAGVKVMQTGDATPQINISSTYGSLVNSTNPNAPASSYGPGMLFTGSIETVTGAINIDNTLGSLALPGEVIGQIINIVAPNGVSTIGSAATQVTYLLADPYSQWASYMIWPGGNPANGAPNAALAIAYVASSEYGNAAANNGISLTQETIGTANGDGTTTPSGIASSYVYYGSCLAASGFGDCSNATAIANSPSLQAFTIDPAGGPNYYYFSVVPSEQLAVTVQQTPNTPGFTSPSSSSVLGRQILVEGKYIDVSGTITSGQTTAWSASLPASLDTTIAIDQLFYNDGLVASPLFKLPVTTINANDAPITAQYNAATGQIQLQSVYAASGSGSVKLDGGIIGTSTYANIQVNTGLGQVTVNNQTNAPLVVQDVNVGSATANSALVSTVEIIDTLKPTGDPGNPDHFFYQYTAGQGLEILTATSPTATIGQATLMQAATPGSNSTTYTPVQGTRFQWVEEASLSRTVNETVNGQDELTSFSIGNWTFNAGATANNPWLYLDPTTNTLTASPTGQVLFNQGEGPAFEETVSGTSGSVSSVGVTYHGCNGTTCHFGFPAYGSNDGSTWTYQFPTTAALTLTTSVRADYPIGISFSGTTTGAIDIVSDTPVTIAGKLYNPSGATTISAAAASAGQPSIIETAGGSITAASLTLIGTTGIGTPANPVAATLTQATQGGPYGALNVRAGSGGIYLALGSGATIGSILAMDNTGYGDVVVSAASDLLAGPGTGVTGRNITLTSTAGAIGSSEQALLLSPSGQGGASGGIVNLAALNDIDIELASGNLLASSIASTGGNVSVKLDAGAVLDAAATTPVDALSSTQLAAIQTTLQLTAADGAATGATNNTINPLNTMVTNAYNQYWALEAELVPNGSVSNGVFTLSQQGLVVFTPLAAQNLGINVTVITPAQVQAYANNLYQRIPDTLAPLFASYFGANWQQLPDFEAKNSNFTLFDRTDNSQAAQTYVSSKLQADATWTLAQLQDAVSYAALQPLSGGIVGTGVPNITGHTVTIVESTGVGTLAAPVFIALSDLLAATLTPQQSAALALASAPGQVQFVATAPSGTITLPITEVIQTDGQYYEHINGQPDVPITLTGITIAQTAPLFVAASNLLDINSNGAIYVQSTLPTLTVGLIQAGSNVSLAAPQSIVSGLGSGQANVAIASGGLQLLAGTGNIGASGLPLIFSVTRPGVDGALITASAGQNAYLDYSGAGALTLGTLFASQTASVTAANGIQPALNELNIAAKNIDLTATQGDIGAVADALEVQVGSSGLLNATANHGSIYVYGPSVSTPTPLNIGTLTAGNLIDVTADSDIVANTLTAGAGGVTAAAGGSGNFTTVTSSGPILLTAATDLTVGSITDTGTGASVQLDAGGAGTVTVATSVASQGTLTVGGFALAMDTGATLSATGAVAITLGGSATIGAITSDLDADNAIDITAGTGGTGGIFSNGDAAGPIATTADARVHLTAADDIGTGVTPLPVDVTWLAADSTGGSIDLSSATALHAASLTAPNGSVTVTGHADLTLDSVTAGKTISADAGDALTVGTATSGGDQTLTALNDIAFTTLTTTLTGNVFVASLDGAVTGGAVAAAAGANLEGNGAVTGSSVIAGGLIGLTSTSGNIAWTTLAAGTTIDAAAGAALTLGTATSTGTQTLHAANAITFAQLTTTGAGDIDATSTGGAIAGGSATAIGSVDFQGDGNVAGAEVMAGGAITLGAGHGIIAGRGDIDWTTLEAGTTIEAFAYGTLTLGTATSVGTQALTAVNDVTFTRLTTTGAGDIDVTSSGGAITGGSVTAVGSIDLQGKGNVTGADATAGGAITLGANSGTIDWTTLQAGTTIDADAGGALTLGAATSAGTQTLTAANDVTFMQLKATGTGNIGVTSSGGNVLGGAVSAGGNASLQGQMAVTGSTITAGGSITLGAAEGAIGWTTLTAGTAIDATAGGAITLVTATSTGGQTLMAVGDIGFQMLTANSAAGTIDTTSTGGSIAGGVVSAGGSAALTAANDNTGATITATDAITLNAGGLIRWNVLTAGATLTADAGGMFTVGTATSGGTQAVTAGNGIAFTRLTTTGRAADIRLDATGGSVSGPTLSSSGAVAITAAGGIDVAESSSAGPQTWGAGSGIDATDVSTTGTDPRGGNIALGTAAGTLMVGSVTTPTGALSFTSGGDIDVATASAAGAITAAAGGSVTIGTWVSGGTQTITAANDVDFTQITTTGTPTDPGDVDITSVLGAINGGSIDAHGSVDLNGNGITFATIDAGGNGSFVSTGVFSGRQVNVAGNLTIQGGAGGIALTGLNATTLTLTTPGTLTITSLTVLSSLDLEASTIDANLTQAAGAVGPLMMNVTGYHGGIADSANLTINAPNGVDFGNLDVDTAVIATTAHDVVIAHADIPNSLTLTTPDGTVYDNNASADDPPVIGVQLYQPGGVFTVTQRGVTTTTDAYVIDYLPEYTVVSVDFTDNHTDATPDFTGSASIRDSTWNMVQDLQAAQNTANATVPFPAPGIAFTGGESPVSASDTVPAVNLSDAPANDAAPR